LLIATLVLLVGCARDEDVADRPISWTGAPGPIQAMVEGYLDSRETAARTPAPIFDRRYYSRPTPFFLYRGNDDAVTLALSARLPTSLPPIDVYYIDLYWFKNFEPQWLESFESMTVPLNGTEVRLEEAIEPDLVSACRLKDVFSAMPLSIRGNCLYYRADLVREPPRTWPELLAVAKEVLASRPPEDPLKTGLVFHWHELHTDMYPVLWGYGGGPPRCLTAAGELDRPLASQENLEAIKAIYDLIHLERITDSIEALEQRDLEKEKDLFLEFAQGRTLFSIDWTNRAARIAAELSKKSQGEFTADHIGLAPIPHAPGLQQSFATIGSWGWVVAQNPRSPRSLDFVRAMAAPNAQLYFFENYAEVPIFGNEVLRSIPSWPAAEKRLSKYHHELLDLIHGDSDREGLTLRDRPAYKPVNGWILEALQDVLAAEPNGNPPAFNDESARQRLAAADRQILAFLKRSQALGIGRPCDPAATSTLEVSIQPASK
jgi:ABC-type glycerol-3-phosphate transport system substrate-binding protein